MEKRTEKLNFMGQLNCVNHGSVKDEHKIFILRKLLEHLTVLCEQYSEIYVKRNIHCPHPHNYLDFGLRCNENCVKIPFPDLFWIKIRPISQDPDTCFLKYLIGNGKNMAININAFYSLTSTLKMWLCSPTSTKTWL